MEAVGDKSACLIGGVPVGCLGTGLQISSKIIAATMPIRRVGIWFLSRKVRAAAKRFT